MPLFRISGRASTGTPVNSIFSCAELSSSPARGSAATAAAKAGRSSTVFLCSGGTRPLSSATFCLAASHSWLLLRLPIFQTHFTSSFLSASGMDSQHAFASTGTSLPIPSCAGSAGVIRSWKVCSTANTDTRSMRTVTVQYYIGASF